MTWLEPWQPLRLLMPSKQPEADAVAIIISKDLRPRSKHPLAEQTNMTRYLATDLFFWKHLTVKRLLFLLLAGAFIFQCSCTATQETEIFISVAVQNIPEGLMITGKPPAELELLIRGPKSLVQRLASKKINYALDLSTVTPGINNISIHPDHLNLPDGIAIAEETSHLLLTLRIAHELQKELPITITVTGKPKSGYLTTKTIPEPTTVILKGPRNILSSMETVLTKSIDINGLTDTLKKEIALDLVEDLTIVNPSSVIVGTILIEEKVVTRTFKNIVVNGKNTTHNYIITPPAINMEVKGPENILENLSTDTGLEVYVDLKGLEPGVIVRRATITLPLKTALVGATPELFTVKIDQP
jgi:hypothetical protein